MKIRLLISWFVVFFSCTSQKIFSQNPIAEFYAQEGYPAWTDSIKWHHRINMATYSIPGKPNATLFEKFEHARDVLYAQGGGVLYYPAGIYNFADTLTGGFPEDSVHSRGLMLKSGVVLMGEKPTSDSLATKNEDGTMNLGTKFIFPFRKVNIRKPAIKIRFIENVRNAVLPNNTLPDTSRFERNLAPLSSISYRDSVVVRAPTYVNTTDRRLSPGSPSGYSFVNSGTVLRIVYENRINGGGSVADTSKYEIYDIPRSSLTITIDSTVIRAANFVSSNQRFVAPAGLDSISGGFRVFRFEVVTNGVAGDTSIFIRNELDSNDVFIREVGRDTVLRASNYVNANTTRTLRDSVTQWRILGQGEVPGRWNLVGIMPGSPTEQLKDIKNVGVCWIDFEGAIVYMGMQLEWNTRYDTIGFSVTQRRAWESRFVKTGTPWGARKPDGTHFLDIFCGARGNSNGFEATFEGAPSNIVIFGCQFNNATPFVDQIDYTKKSWIYAQSQPGEVIEAYNEPDFYHTYRFVGRLTVYGSNIFVANNSIPKPNKNFLYTQLTYDRNNRLGHREILFDYAKTIGIDINKQLTGQVSVLQRKTVSSTSPYYLPNIIVQDNFVYSHGQKGYEISGEWVIIKRNRNKRDFLDQDNTIYGLPSAILTLDGSLVANEIDDNLSRAFDLSGKSMWIDSNWFNSTGSHPGNDGEGILCQRHGDVEIFDWAITRNRYQQLSGEPSYMAGYDVHVLGMLTYKNIIPSGAVGHYPKPANIIKGAAWVNNISAQIWGTNPTQYSTTPEFIASCPTIKPTQPFNLQVTPEPHLGRTRISWTDTSSFEIGFRVERRNLTGDTTWKLIAYRPMKALDTVLTSDLGYPGLIASRPIPPTIWYDYTTTGLPVEYRVIAIGCSEFIKADFTYRQPDLCRKDSLVFFDSTQYDWNDFFRSAEWDFNGDGVTDLVQNTVNQNVSYVFSPGTYHVKLKITSNNYDYDSIIKTIVIGSVPIIDFSVSGTLHVGQKIYFKGLTLPTGATYAWDFNGDGTYDLTTDRDTVVSFVYTSANTYSVKLRVVQGSCVDSVAKSITVVVPNQAPTNILLSQSAINENNQIGDVVGTFSAIDPNTGDTFTFSLVSGTGSTDNASFSIVGNQLKAAQVFDYELKNSYSIRVRVTDNGGLSFEKVFTITINDVNETPLGFYLPSNVEWVIAYPNPTRDKLYFDWAKAFEKVSVSVVNVLGETLSSYVASSNQLPYINLSNFPAGRYFVKVSSGQGIKIISVLKE
ncbi:MAG: T9SS type A sorting domain-containing protein [Cytophagales bacterium]|nr:T9SS type A sorting domain-containing protein [Cytophagales bacterium]MDW8384179.1 T9SS type A sorting domain-containing protein [Flammeovirgaceae bacterium]